MAGRRWMGGEGRSCKLVDRVLYKAKHKGHWGLFLLGEGGGGVGVKKVILEECSHGMYPHSHSVSCYRLHINTSWKYKIWCLIGYSLSRFQKKLI